MSPVQAQVGWCGGHQQATRQVGVRHVQCVVAVHRVTNKNAPQPARTMPPGKVGAAAATRVAPCGAGVATEGKVARRCGGWTGAATGCGG